MSDATLSNVADWEIFHQRAHYKDIKTSADQVCSIVSGEAERSVRESKPMLGRQDNRVALIDKLFKQTVICRSKQNGFTELQMKSLIGRNG